jgi:hypothetical protein
MSLGVHQNTAEPGPASPDGSPAFPINVISVAKAALPTGATSLAGSSGIVTQPAASVATLASAPGRLAHLTGLSVIGFGLKNAVLIPLTIAGLEAGTINFGYAIPGATSATGVDLTIVFGNPMPASALGTDIVVTLAAFGDNTDQGSVMAMGYMI